MTQLNEEIAEEFVFSTTKYRNIVEQDWFLKINRIKLAAYLIGHLTRYYTVAASILMGIFFRFSNMMIWT